MSQCRNSDDDLNAQAASWAIRSFSPDFSADDLDALNDWLERSEAHHQAFAHAEHVWLAAQAPATTAIPIRPRTPANDTTPKQRPWWHMGAAAAALVAAIGGAALLTHREMPTPSAIYQTLKGERRHVLLADGSILDLNTDTRLKVTLSNTKRRIELERGEVLFSVAHDPARPLTVTAGSTRVDDIGTRFVVYRAPAIVRISVLEGSVATSTGSDAESAPQILTANQSFSVAGGHSGPVGQIEAEDQIAWLNSEVSYKDESLAVVADDLSRYFNKPIVVAPSARQFKLTAAINIDSEDLVVKRLEAFLPITASTTSQYILLRRR